jgi:glucuronate isomerase
VNQAFQDLKSGKSLSQIAGDKFKSAVLYEMSKMYHEKGWSQLFHLGALRDNNTRLRNALGPDCGTDSIGDFPQAVHLSRFFDRLDKENKLAPTVIFNLNPADNEVFASMAGNFNDGSMAGKIQFGSGWWFLDQKDGMEKQMNALSNLGLLSQFVGMVTDSRSFLSYPRHEYFRRILCNLIGRDVVNGELPHDLPWLGSMVQDICYNNAHNYFKFH